VAGAEGLAPGAGEVVAAERLAVAGAVVAGAPVWAGAGAGQRPPRESEPEVEVEPQRGPQRAYQRWEKEKEPSGRAQERRKLVAERRTHEQR
jgi:hypothetical protein